MNNYYWKNYSSAPEYEWRERSKRNFDDAKIYNCIQLAHMGFNQELIPWNIYHELNIAVNHGLTIELKKPFFPRLLWAFMLDLPNF